MMHYGPMNAFADILSAYLEKQRMEGAMDYASKYGQQIDDQTKPADQKITNITPWMDMNGKMQSPDHIADDAKYHIDDTLNNMGTGAVQGASQPVQNMASPNIPSQPLPGGVLDSALRYGGNSMQLNQPQQAQSGLLQAADNIAQSAGENTPQDNSQPSDNTQTMDNSQQSDTQQQAVPNNEIVRQTLGWNPQPKEFGAEPTVDGKLLNQMFELQQKNIAYNKSIKPLTYDQYVQKTSQLKPQAMRDIIRKYGIDAAKQVEPMIDNVIKQKQSEYGEGIDNANRQQLAKYLLGSNLNTPSGMKQALWAATEYNRLAQQMGKPTVDIATVGKMLDSGKISITAKDTGGSVNFYAIPKDGGTFDDGSYIKPVLTQGKTPTPGETINANLKQQQMTEQHRHNVAMENRPVSRGGGGGGGGSRGGGGGRQQSFNSKYKPVVSAITKQIEDGYSKSEIYTKFCDAGGTEEEWNELWTPSVNKYYHGVQGDDARDDSSYLGEDGEPEGQDNEED